MCFLIFLLVLGSAVFVDGNKIECVYSSREYQVVLNPEILSGANSFANGVSLVLDQLTVIEKAGAIDFKVARSSLKFKNVTVVKYSAQSPEDLQFPIIMKSRKKKLNEPADFVIKISNADPTLTCIPLEVADIYSGFSEAKFELDFHVAHGTVMSKSAMSYSVDMPTSVKFSQSEPVYVSSIFVDSAKKLTHSGQPIIGEPSGSGVQLTAEFDIRLSGEKFKASLFLLDINNSPKAEFSFRIKDTHFDENILTVAQQVASKLSNVAAITLPEEATAVC